MSITGESGGDLSRLFLDPKKGVCTTVGGARAAVGLGSHGVLTLYFCSTQKTESAQAVTADDRVLLLEGRVYPLRPTPCLTSQSLRLVPLKRRNKNSHILGSV